VGGVGSGPSQTDFVITASKEFRVMLVVSNILFYRDFHLICGKEMEFTYISTSFLSLKEISK